MAEFYLGQVLLAGFNFAPRGFALCNGQILPISQNAALFSLLGTTYGGDGRVTFALPDLRGRTPLGAGSSADPSWQPPAPSLGQVSGSETVTLLSSQLPVHTHALSGINSTGTLKNPTANAYGSVVGNPLYGPSTGPQVPLAPQSIGNAGNTQPHQNMQPFRAITFAIALTGVFPSRN